MPPTTSRLEQNGHVQRDSLTRLISPHTLELRRLSSPSAREHHAAESSTRRGRARVGLRRRHSGRIDILSTPQHRGLEVRILDRLCNDQVNLPAEDPRQLILQTEEISKSIITTRLEINKKVNVAGIGIEMIGKYRPENTQSSSTEPGACLRQRLGIDRHFIRHRTMTRVSSTPAAEAAGGPSTAGSAGGVYRTARR